MKFYCFVLLCFLFVSCNYKFLVHKKYIVQEQKGFLLFYYSKPHQEAIFFPFKDTIDRIFLNKNHKNGYRIQDKDLDYLKDMAVKHSFKQYVLINGKSVLTTDTLTLIPVAIRYYFGSAWRTQKFNSEKVLIRYEHNDKGRELAYHIYDDRIILGISLTRKNDLLWLDKNIQKYLPSKFEN